MSLLRVTTQSKNAVHLHFSDANLELDFTKLCHFTMNRYSYGHQKWSKAPRVSMFPLALLSMWIEIIIGA
jgi:hypothetical protein